MFVLVRTAVLVALFTWALTWVDPLGASIERRVAETVGAFPAGGSR